MLIFKSIAIAALTVGIAGSALAAQSQFIAQDVVEGIVRGDIESMFERSSDERKHLLVQYTIGFAGGLHHRCEILNRKASADVGQYLRGVADEREADQRAGRQSTPQTLAVMAGFQDGASLADGYGCRSNAGIGAARTVQQLLAGPSAPQGQPRRAVVH